MNSETYEKDVYDIITERFTKLKYRSGMANPCPDETLETVTDENGIHFKDIDYGFICPSNWPTVRHLMRLEAMLSSAGPEKIKADCLGGRKYIGLLDFWLKNDFRNPNWWHNEIGTPMHLSSCCFMLKDYLTNEQLEKADAIIGMGSYRDNKNIDRWTGANLVWGALNTLNHALLLKDRELLEWAVNRAMGEVVIKGGRGEGIKPDMSFFQHGTLNYTFGYGRSFIKEATRLFYILSGTEFMPPKEKTELFERFVLDGARYFTIGCRADFMTTGREFSRLDNVKNDELIEPLKMMTETAEFERKDEIRRFYESLAYGKKDSARGLKNFDSSYMITQYTGESYMSARGIHTDILCTEAGNKENYLCANFTDGATVCFMYTGEEYSDISPLWDFTLVPGTTAVEESEKELAGHTNDFGAWFARPGRTDNCKTALSDNISVISMRFEHNPVKGHLTRVLTDGNMILCGSDIHISYEPEKITDRRDFYNLEGKNLRTSIDQARKISYLGSEEIKFGTLGKNEKTGNGGFFYTNLCDNEMTAEISENVRGIWNKNDRELRDEVPDVYDDMFRLYFNHGNCENAENISYAVCVTEVGKEAACECVEFYGGKQIVKLKNGKTVTVDYTAENCEITIK